MFQGYRISFSNNALLNKLTDETRSIKEVALKDPKIHFHMDKFVNQVIKRGEDNFNEQSRKNGLRYFTSTSWQGLKIEYLCLVSVSNPRLIVSNPRLSVSNNIRD